MRLICGVPGWDGPWLLLGNPGEAFVTGTTVTRQGEWTGATVAYQAATGANMWTALNPGDSTISAAISPDGSTVFTAGTHPPEEGMVTVAYSAASGAILWTQVYSPQAGVARAIAVSPDGSTVLITGGVPAASPGDNEYATVAYAAATGTMRWVQLQNGAYGSFVGGSQALAVSPDGARVFVTGGLTTARGTSYGTVAYNTATGAKLWLTRYPSHSTTVRTAVAASLAVSPDGSTVFVTDGVDSGYGTVDYATATGAQQWAALYRSRFSGASSVAVSPDGSTVFVTGTSGKPNQNSNYATLASLSAKLS